MFQIVSEAMAGISSCMILFLYLIFVCSASSPFQVNQVIKRDGPAYKETTTPAATHTIVTTVLTVTLSTVWNDKFNDTGSPEFSRLCSHFTTQLERHVVIAGYAGYTCRRASHSQGSTKLVGHIKTNAAGAGTSDATTIAHRYLYAVGAVSSKLGYSGVTAAADGDTIHATTGRVRYASRSHQGKEALIYMQEAFKKMRKLDCTDGTSWYYQGGIHQVPPISQIQGKKYPYCETYFKTRKLQFGWNDCPHNGSPNAKWHFILWHRLYIYHLEKIVREISGVEAFSLPYWEYIVEAGRKMERPFQEEDSSLYNASRNHNLNAGKQIPEYEFKITRKGVEKMDGLKQFYLFSQSLEKGIHNDMHGFIGSENIPYYNPIVQSRKTGLMGLVDSSAFDPIFYLHHGIIDYLFWRWDTSAYGRRPCLETLKRYPWRYNFINPDGTKITYTTEEAYDKVYNPDYTYYGLPANSPSADRPCSSHTDSTLIMNNPHNDTAPGNQSEYTIDFANNYIKKLNGLYNATDENLLLSLELNLVTYEPLCEAFPAYIRYNVSGVIRPDEYIGTVVHFPFSDEINGKERKLSFTFEITEEYKKYSEYPFQIVLKSKGQCCTKWNFAYIDVYSVNIS